MEFPYNDAYGLLIVLTSLVFGFGVVAQALLLLRGGKVNYAFILGTSLVLALFAFMPAKNEHAYNLDAHIIMSIWYFFLAFAFVTTFVGRDAILPVINEATVLSMTVLAWGIILGNMPAVLYCIVPAAIATPFVILIAFTDVKLPNFAQAFFYGWFMFTVLTAAYFQITAGGYAIPFGTMPPDPNIPELVVKLFLTGMVTMYAVAYLLYLFELVPVPGKHQSISDRIRQWLEYMDFLATKYSEDQLKPLFAFLVILAEGGVLITNHAFHLVPDLVVVNAIIVLSQFTPQFMFRKCETGVRRSPATS